MTETRIQTIGRSLAAPFVLAGAILGVFGWAAISCLAGMFKKAR